VIEIQLKDKVIRLTEEEFKELVRIVEAFKGKTEYEYREGGYQSFSLNYQETGRAHSEK